MPRIEGELQTSTEDPTECDGLGNFSCGDGSLGSVEAEIEELIDDIRVGNWPGATLRVTRESQGRTIIGIVVVEQKGALVDDDRFHEFKDAAHVVLLALSARYRHRDERYMCRHGTPLSEVLLSHTFRYLADLNGGVMPAVQAVVAKANEPSQKLVARHGFEIPPIRTVGGLFYVRAKRLGLPTVPANTICTCLTGHEVAH